MQDSRADCPVNVGTTKRKLGKEKSPKYRFTTQDRSEMERQVWHSSECFDSLKSLEPPPEAPVPPASVWRVVGPACLLPGRVLTPINGDRTVPHRHRHRTEGTLSGRFTVSLVSYSLS